MPRDAARVYHSNQNHLHRRSSQASTKSLPGRPDRRGCRDTILHHQDPPLMTRHSASRSQMAHRSYLNVGSPTNRPVLPSHPVSTVVHARTSSPCRPCVDGSGALMGSSVLARLILVLVIVAVVGVPGIRQFDPPSVEAQLAEPGVRQADGSAAGVSLRTAASSACRSITADVAPASTCPTLRSPRYDARPLRA